MDEMTVSYQRDIEIEETLKQLAEKDPDIKRVLGKIERALKAEFKMRPWRYMFLSGIDPEIVMELKPVKIPLKALREWRFFSFVVGLLVGMTLYSVSDWGLFNLRWMVVVGVAMGVIEIWKREIEYRIKKHGGLKQ